MHAQAFGDHNFIVALRKWSAQGGVEMFHTHLCVNVGLPGLAVVDHTFIFLLALQLLQGDNDALHTHICYELDSFPGPCY